MPKRILYLAAYDVRKPSRLRAALKRVRGHATGGQKSVHEVFLTPRERDELLHDLHYILDEQRDRFVLVRLDPRSQPRLLGTAQPPQDPDYFYSG